MRYGFEYMDEKGMWHRSAVEHKDMTAACDAAASWLEVCAANGYYVAVRLIKI